MFGKGGREEEEVGGERSQLFELRRREGNGKQEGKRTNVLMKGSGEKEEKRIC